MSRNRTPRLAPCLGALLLSAVVSCVAASSRAAFVGGLATFDGAAKDLLTWEQTLAGAGSSIAQNDAIEIEGVGGWADYTTTFTIGIGESAEVEISDFGTPLVGVIRFLLTTNSGGTGAPVVFDDGYTGLQWNSGIGRFLTCVGANGSCAGSPVGPGILDPHPEPHILRVHRTSLTSATYTVIRKSDASVLGSVVLPVPASLPADLHVALTTAGSGVVVFDDVFIPSLTDRCGDGVPDARFGEECDDGNTSDGDCCSGVCAYDMSGAPCDDATVCNGAETCDGAGTCQAGSPPDCDDGDLCTQDTCDAVLGCESAGTPWDGCVAGFAKGSLLVKEKAAGREKIIARLKRLETTVLQEDFGDPVAGGTAYATCIFDDTGALVASLNVDRAGAACAGKECWKAAGFGWKYKDKDAASDGVGQMKLFGGPSGKGQIQIKAANAAKKGQVSLPVGVASSLASATSVRLQLVASDAPLCFEATLDDVRQQEVDSFKAVAK